MSNSRPTSPADQATTVADLRALVERFVTERDWHKFHDAKNLSMSLAIEAAELMEHFQWTRSDELPALLADPQRRAAVLDEIADVACFLLGLVNVLDADLAAAVHAKMEKNARKYPADQYRGWYEKPPRT